MVNRKWGYIDKSGKFVINPQFDEAGMYSDGMALDSYRRPVRIHRSIGKICINPQFEASGNFNDGLALVRLNGKFGYIDRNGKS